MMLGNASRVGEGVALCMNECVHLLLLVGSGNGCWPLVAFLSSPMLHSSEGICLPLSSTLSRCHLGCCDSGLGTTVRECYETVA